MDATAEARMAKSDAGLAAHAPPAAAPAANRSTNGQPDVSGSLQPLCSTDTNREFQKDLDKAIEQSLQDQELIKIASTSAAPPARPKYHTTLDLPQPQDVLSDDEGDLQTLKRNSFSKVMSWNDGSKKLVAKHAAISRLQGDVVDGVTGNNTHDKLQRLSNATLAAKIEPRTIQPFKHDPLKGMVPIENTKMPSEASTTSFLALSEGSSRRKAVRKSKPCNLSYSEAVTRTPNTGDGTVTVSFLPRKRQGKRGQPSYFDITSELHYLR